jgi:hypothetical protein
VILFCLYAAKNLRMSGNSTNVIGDAAFLKETALAVGNRPANAILLSILEMVCIRLL